jgi:hypothetical protein
MIHDVDAADPIIGNSQDDNETCFTEEFIQMDRQQQYEDEQQYYEQQYEYRNPEYGNEHNPILLQPNETMGSYDELEAKPTKATLAETFSSGGDGEYHYGAGHTFSTEEHANRGDEDFLNLAEETEEYRHRGGGTFDTYENEDDGRDDYLSNEDDLAASTYSEGAEFIDLAQEAAQIPSRHYRSTVNMNQDDFESYAERYGLEEEQLYDEDGTILRFVDSEDGQAFSFRTKRPDGYGDVTAMPYITEEGENEGLQPNPSLEATSMGYDSKTLNTNLETLHTDLEGVNYIPTMNEHDVLHDPAYQLDGEGESYDDDEARIAGGFEDIYDNTNAAGISIPQNSSYQYEEDGFIRYNDDDHNHPDDDLRKQDTFQETVGDTITEFTKEDDNTRADGQTVLLSQLMDSYLSDRSTESWDEGSYASRSRAVSRLDSFDGTEFTEDTRRGDGLLLNILKDFRDNVKDYRDGVSFDEHDDDDDAESQYHENGDGEKRRKSKSRRRSSRRKSGKSDLNKVLGELGTIGMNLVSETFEKAQGTSSDKRRRRSRRGDDPAGRLIESFRDIFSCGAPRNY